MGWVCITFEWFWNYRREYLCPSSIQMTTRHVIFDANYTANKQGARFVERPSAQDRGGASPLVTPTWRDLFYLLNLFAHITRYEWARNSPVVNNAITLAYGNWERRGSQIFALNRLHLKLMDQLRGKICSPSHIPWSWKPWELQLFSTFLPTN